MLGDGIRQLRKRLLVKLLAGLIAVGHNLRQPQRCDRSVPVDGIFRKKSVQPFSQATFFCQAVRLLLLIQ